MRLLMDAGGHGMMMMMLMMTILDQFVVDAFFLFLALTSETANV